MTPPMKLTAGTMSTCKKAKVIPTARASMLVATARGSMLLGPKSPAGHSSWRDSRTMLKPMKASSTKAIQWSNWVMREANCRPSR